MVRILGCGPAAGNGHLSRHVLWQSRTDKEKHCVVPTLQFSTSWNGPAAFFFQSPCFFLCFDQSNQINSPLDSPADLVALAHKLSKKCVRDVPPAASDTTQASSACTDLIRNTMPFIFLAHRGRLAGLQLQEQGCRSFSILLFFCLSLSAIHQEHFYFVYFAWLPSIDC